MQEEEHTSGYGEPSKAYRVVKGCFKGILYGASALVWILIFYVIFTTRESKLMDQMHFTDATRDLAKQTENYRVYQIYPADFMNQGGSIELGNVYYARETGELEIGVKYNKKMTDGNTKDGIRYVLTDQDGKEYAIKRIETDVIGRYGYARICFGELSLPVEQSDDWEMQITLSLYKKDSELPLTSYISADRTEEINNATFLVFTNFKKPTDPTDPAYSANFPDPTVTQKVKYDD